MANQGSRLLDLKVAFEHQCDSRLDCSTAAVRVQRRGHRESQSDNEKVRVSQHGVAKPHRKDTLDDTAGEHAQWDDVHGTPCGQVAQVHLGLHVPLGPRFRLLDEGRGQLLV